MSEFLSLQKHTAEAYLDYSPVKVTDKSHLKFCYTKTMTF